MEPQINKDGTTSLSVICVHLWFPLPCRRCRAVRQRSGDTLRVRMGTRREVCSRSRNALRNVTRPQRTAVVSPSVRLVPPAPLRSIWVCLRLSTVVSSVRCCRPLYASRASLRTPTCNHGRSVLRRHPRQPTEGDYGPPLHPGDHRRPGPQVGPGPDAAREKITSQRQEPPWYPTGPRPASPSGCRCARPPPGVPDPVHAP